MPVAGYAHLGKNEQLHIPAGGLLTEAPDGPQIRLFISGRVIELHGSHSDILHPLSHPPVLAHVHHSRRSLKKCQGAGEAKASIETTGGAGEDTLEAPVHLFRGYSRWGK